MPRLVVDPNTTQCPDYLLDIREATAGGGRQGKRGTTKRGKEAKFAPILPRGVPTTPPIIVSAIATQRMDKGDYIPLWYFTNASLDDAAKAFSILEEDALSLVKRDNGSTLLVLALDSSSVVQDSKMTSALLHHA